MKLIKLNESGFFRFSPPIFLDGFLGDFSERSEAAQHQIDRNFEVAGNVSHRNVPTKKVTDAFVQVRFLFEVVLTVGVAGKGALTALALVARYRLIVPLQLETAFAAIPILRSAIVVAAFLVPAVGEDRSPHTEYTESESGVSSRIQCLGKSFSKCWLY